MSISCNKSSKSKFSVDLDRVDFLLLSAALSAYSTSLKSFAKKYSIDSDTPAYCIERCNKLSRLFDDFYHDF